MYKTNRMEINSAPHVPCYVRKPRGNWTGEAAHSTDCQETFANAIYKSACRIPYHKTLDRKIFSARLKKDYVFI